MKFMDEALIEAKRAYYLGEVPIGAVIALDGEIISRAHNTCVQDGDCTCHAEINAIKKACTFLGSRLLTDCEMYVSVEPCAMCAGAIINARIKRLYIGALEPKTGACQSKAELLKPGLFNHDVDVYYGIGEDKARDLMSSFFEDKR